MLLASKCSREFRKWRARKYTGFAEYRPDIYCSVTRLLGGCSIVVGLSLGMSRFCSRPAVVAGRIMIRVLGFPYVSIILPVLHRDTLLMLYNLRNCWCQ